MLYYASPRMKDGLAVGAVLRLLSVTGLANQRQGFAVSRPFYDSRKTEFLSPWLHLCDGPTHQAFLEVAQP